MTTTSTRLYLPQHGGPWSDREDRAGQRAIVIRSPILVALTAVFTLACRTDRPVDRASPPDSGRAVTSARSPGASEPAPPPAIAMAMAARHAPSPTADTIALDSCARLDTLARPPRRVDMPGDPFPEPHAGSWSATRVAATPRFTIELPSSAAAFWSTRDGGFATEGFPGCLFSCMLTVDFRHDSVQRGAGDFVDRWRRAAVAAGEDAASEAPGPSRNLTVDGRPAVLVEIPCGDCRNEGIFAARGDTIAEISFSIDDREGYQPGLACRLARVAQSFQWP